jgi:anti-sigma-K factor RskA
VKRGTSARPTEGHVTASLSAHALGSLDPGEERRVLDHLTACPACRAALEAERETVDLLALAAPREEPPAGLERKVLAAVRASAGSSPRRAALPRLSASRWLLGIAAAACFVATVVLAVANIGLARDVRRLSARSLPEQPLVAVLAGTATAPRATGVLILGADARTGTLAVQGLAALDDGRQYQLWLIRDGARTSGGVFSVDGSGRGSVHVVAPLPLTAYPSFGITIEPAGGSAGPTGSKVLGGSL